jgi:alpha-glucosidase (family GH31 glycosyl hydrolase)
VSFPECWQSRKVYFPRGAGWVSFWDRAATPIAGGVTKEIDAPLDTIPVYVRA